MSLVEVELGKRILHLHQNEILIVLCRKTTTMLFRMLFRQISESGLNRPLRQLFVTQSRVLAGRVEEYYNELVRTYQTRTKSLEEIAHLSETVVANRTSNLIAKDDKDDERKDLPSRFSKLEDKHFPLFLTFNQVSDLAMLKVVRYLSFFSFYRHSFVGYWSPTSEPAAAARNVG